MARSLDQILTELNSGGYQAQKDQYNNQIQAVDPTMQADEQGLEAAKTDAFANITQAANRSGMFYSGMPIAEEQRYTGATFLPALANLRSKYAQQKFDLTSALNKVSQDEMTQAQGIHQNELDLEEKQREFDQQLAAAKATAGAGGASPSFGFGGGPSVAGAGSTANYSQKANGGFAFTDANGSPISAATYSQLTGIPFRSLLQSMANAGDTGAKTALNFVGNDYGYNPNMVGTNAATYNALIWGAVNPRTGKPLSQAQAKVIGTPAYAPNQNVG